MSFIQLAHEDGCPYSSDDPELEGLCWSWRDGFHRPGSPGVPLYPRLALLDEDRIRPPESTGDDWLVPLRAARRWCEKWARNDATRASSRDLTAMSGKLFSRLQRSGVPEHFDLGLLVAFLAAVDHIGHIVPADESSLDHSPADLGTDPDQIAADLQRQVGFAEEMTGHRHLGRRVRPYRPGTHPGPMKSLHPEQHVVVTDLGFGDAGKGVVTDRLAAQGARLVVRFSGGAQAAHNVVVGDLHHTFHQFGAGTLAGVPTHLAATMLVNPYQLSIEAEQLGRLGIESPMKKLSVDPLALVTTPVHEAANRAREDQRGEDRHGSTGLGIGETTWYGLNFDALRVRDCFDVDTLRTKLRALADHYSGLIQDSDHGHPSIDEMVDVLSAFRYATWIVPTVDLVRNLSRLGRIIFEGSQGVLLDEWNGFHPHTTWATVTSEHARAIARDAGIDVTVLGVCRAYMSRHGAGPFPTEDDSLFDLLPERHNEWGQYQGAWRVGHLDLPLLRYAVAANGGIDALAVTHLDAVADAGGAVKVARSYRVDGAFVERFSPVEQLRLDDEPAHLAQLEALTRTLSRAEPVYTDLDDPAGLLEAELGAPVVMRGRGPARADG